MPWLGKAAAVLEAWYPGARGGEAIANVLFGTVNPSGRLPITFPKSIDQNPRPVIPGSDQPEPGMPIGADAPAGKPIDVVYSEGADVGYRLFAKKKMVPLYPFGYGLSYSTFDYKNLKVSGGKTLTISFDVTNTGAVAGADVPQVYLTGAPDKTLQRLIGFNRIELQPGETKQVTVTADPRLLADYDVASHGWRVKAGQFKIAVSHAATAATLEGAAAVEGTVIKP
jgi:beta-glucosidase